MTPAPQATRRWPRFSLAWALGAMSILCVLLAAYQAWGIDAMPLWWLTVIIASVAVFGRNGHPGLAMVICIAATMGLMTLVVRHGHGPSSRLLQCKNNLALLALATQNYGSARKQFPQSAGGEEGLSWRVSLLPFVEEWPLYSKFKRREPWDGPTNTLLLDSMPRYIFRCPEDLPRSDRNTSYVAIHGNDTLWPPNRLLGAESIPDGASNTLLFTEMHDSNIAWTEPRDLDADSMDWRVDGTRRNSPSSMHGPTVEYFDGSRRMTGRGKINVALADGSTRTLSSNIDPEVLKQMANRRDGLPKELP